MVDKYTNKKRKNSKEGKMDVDEDYKMYYDQKNSHLLDKESGEDLNQIVDVDFLFSEIRSTYFFGIKNFLEGLLNFDEFDSSGVADLIVGEKDFLGTVVKCELEEESGNELPDLYALTTLLPCDFFADKKGILQILNFCIANAPNGSELKQFMEGMQRLYTKKDVSNEVFNKFKLGVFINERIANLPQPLIGPLLNLLREDIANYKEANDGNKKYDVTHVLYITKVVKDSDNANKETGKKKMPFGNSNANQDKYLFYKYDDEYFLKEAECTSIFKVPLEEKELENLENKNEPIYKAIMVLTAERFYKVIDFLSSQK